MSPRLTKFSVSNFRSIRGKIDLDLDAPIVLIHGPNGSGKTSLLLALELALTGSVNSLQRGKQEKFDSLIHVGADHARISLSCQHPDIQNKPAELFVRKNGIEGQPLLSKDQIRFYTERCFLTQSNLSRLLEIYEGNDTRSEKSPLTKFVQELLGLDVLDNVVDGMHHLRHVSRLRKSLPLYEEVEDERSRAQKAVETLAHQLEVKEVELTHKENSLKEALTDFNFDNTVDVRDAAKSILDQDDGAEEAQKISVLNREVSAAHHLWENISQHVDISLIETAENTLRTESQLLESWTAAHRGSLIEVLDAASTILRAMPNPSIVGFAQAHEEISMAVGVELERLTTQINRIDGDKKLFSKTKEQHRKSVARLSRLDARTAELSKDSGALAAALSELLPHVSNDECPVCSRNFSEVSDIPLSAHLATHIASLSQTANQLHEVAVERQAAVRINETEKRLINDLESRLEDDAVRNELTSTVSRLSEISLNLKSRSGAAQEGERHRQRVQSASAQLSQLRQNQETISGLRTSTRDFAEQLNLKGPEKSERISDTLQRYLEVIEKKLLSHQQQIAKRRQINSLTVQLQATDKELSSLKEMISQRKAKLTIIDAAWFKAEKTKELGKSLADKAIAVRTKIVRRVFSDSLNAVWEDLFIRLAPDERFIPAFFFPESAKGPVVAELETIFRGNNRKGNPRSMLSAGNLNTAALTLFLSLHLSVEPQLPWLVIDDPVQSMDEIHIAQFAALIRTLSRQRNRQTIIAVHERPLFDYLALELSPAFEGDRLVTVELSRSHDQNTDCHYEMKTWNPESVLKIPMAMN